jgi:hypothetical protein
LNADRRDELGENSVIEALAVKSHRSENGAALVVRIPQSGQFSAEVEGSLNIVSGSGWCNQGSGRESVCKFVKDVATNRFRRVERGTSGRTKGLEPRRFSRPIPTHIQVSDSTGVDYAEPLFTE